MTCLPEQETWIPSPRSEAQAHICLPVRRVSECYYTHPGECYYNTIMLRLFFIVECGIARFLCATRVFDVRALSSSPRLCEISFFFRGLRRYELAHGKIAYSITQSINRSINHPAYLMPREPERDYVTFGSLLSQIRLLSVVCNVRTPYPWVGTFGNISMPFCTLAILWPPCKILRRSSQEKPSVEGVKRNRGSNITFGSGISSPDEFLVCSVSALVFVGNH